MKILSILEIAKLLQEQADLRSEENDEKGVLRNTRHFFIADMCDLDPYYMTVNWMEPGDLP